MDTKKEDFNNGHFDYKADGNHMDGSAFGGTFQGQAVTVATYSAGSPTTCSGISCHGGSGSSVDWDSGTADCTDCYSTPADRSHSTHITDMGYNCSVCHNNFNFRATHFDGNTDNPDSVGDRGEWHTTEPASGSHQQHIFKL